MQNNKWTIIGDRLSMRSPIMLTHYWPRVYSNELGAFLPLLISRAIELTITNIFYDHPLVCRYQLHYEDIPTKLEIQHLQSWSLQVGEARLCFLNLDDRTDEEVEKKGCIYLEYTCANLNFQIGVHMTTLEVVKVHWLDDECLTQWAWMSILKQFWFRVLSPLLKIDPCNRPHPRHENLLPPSSFSVSFYEVPNSFRASSFFKL